MDSAEASKTILGFLSGKAKGYSGGMFFEALKSNNLTQAKGVLSKLQIEEVSEEKVQCNFVVGKDESNPFGSLHGGCIATLADDITTAAIMMVDREHRPGVSISINVDYLLPAAIGEKVTVVAKVLKVGKSIAFSKCEFVNSVCGRQ